MFIFDTLALLIYTFSENLRKIILKNLNIIFYGKISKKEKKRICIRFLSNQIQNLIEFLMMALGFYNIFKFEIVGKKYAKNLYREDRNVSIITAHYGNWELLGAWLTRNKVPLYSIILPPRTSILEKLFEFIRKKNNIGTIVRTESREILKKVNDKNTVVSFVIDQDGEATGYWVPFFKKNVSFPSGAAYFAAKGNMLFQPVLIERMGFLKHRIVFSEPIEIESVIPKDRKKEFVNKVIDFYEKNFYEKPEEWLLFYNRWQYRRHYPICARNSL